MLTLHHDRGPLARPMRVGDTLVVEGHVARVHAPGDGLDYGDHVEHRDISEVRRIVEQLVGVPVTLGHPGGLVKLGAPAHVVGHVERAWLDGEHAAARMVIHDRAAIAAIESGTRELSLGYGCDVDAAGYQTNITLDHLAIVERARCGETCALRADHQPIATTTQGVTMFDELLVLARKLNVRTDALTPRDAALAVLRTVGTNINAPCSDENATPIASRSDDYVIARAFYDARNFERAAERRRDAASFATVPAITTLHTDCGCSSKPARVDDTDLEIESRQRMLRSSRLAYAQGTERADEVEAIERIRERVAKPIARPVVNTRGVVTDEAVARARMLAESRSAYLTSSDDTDSEAN